MLVKKTRLRYSILETRHSVNTEPLPQETVDPIIAIDSSSLLKAMVVGLGVGVITWGLGYLLEAYVFTSICGAGITGCQLAWTYSAAIGAFVAAVVALIALVKLQAFRPLLVVAAVTLGLWQLSLLFGDLVWFGALGLSALLHALAYGLFTWLARIRQFWLCLILVILAIVAIRLFVNY